VLSRTKNGLTTRYVYGAGLQYEVNASGTATYYHYDQTGNTAALTNQSGAIIDRIAYSPYGTIRYRTGTTDTPFLFGGFFGVMTDANGLINMRARYYNPLTMRFINSDPARDGLNWYAYASGNPIGFADPTGFGAAKVVAAVNSGLNSLGMVANNYNAFVANNRAQFPALARAVDFVEQGLSMPGVGGGIGMVRAVNMVKTATTAINVERAVITASKESEAARSYSSFSAFKRAEGAAGPGQAWHHIVEQTPTNVQNFGAAAIHNTENIVALPHGFGGSVKICL